VDFFGERSSHLLKADLRIVDNVTCAKRYKNSSKLKNGILDEFQICAGDSEGKDTCPVSVLRKLELLGYLGFRVTQEDHFSMLSTGI
jgi:hypothetical protein